MCTRFTHPERLPNAPLHDLSVDAILDSQIRAPFTTTDTGDTFLERHRVWGSDRIMGAQQSSHHFSGPGNGTN